MPGSAVEAVRQYLLGSNANSGGVFTTAVRTDEIIAEAHAGLADLLNCTPEEVIVGPNMTTLTFALSRAIGRTLHPGDEIIVTSLDHDANVSPWLALEEERGVVVKFADVNVDDCTLDMVQLKSLITTETKVIAVGYASNAVGTINDVASIIRLGHAVGALVFVDAVHYAPHGPIDVRELDCDFLACSPYKFFAPHAGAIYGKRQHMEKLAPYKVRPATEQLPYRWETGTQNHEALAGVSGAIQYLAELGNRSHGVKASSRRRSLLAAMTSIRTYEKTLSERLIKGLLEVPNLTFYGIKDLSRLDERTPTVAIRIEGLTPNELATELAKKEIYSWDGNYYALGLTQKLGVEETGGMLRLGCVHYNTAEEVDKVVAEIAAIARRTSLATIRGV